VAATTIRTARSRRSQRGPGQTSPRSTPAPAPGPVASPMYDPDYIALEMAPDVFM